MEIKIGVIVPQSRYYAVLGSDFAKCIQMALRGTGIEVKYVFESIGTAASGKLIVESCQKLILDDVNVVVGLIGHQGLEDVFEFFEQNNKLFLYSDFGDGRPRGIAHGRNIFGNSFAQWHSMALGAKHHIDNGKKSVVFSTSFYDAGYALHASYLDTFLDEGGEILLNHIVPRDFRPDEAEQLQMALTNNEPDVVLASFSCQYAEEHAKILKETKLHDKFSFGCTAMTVNSRILSKYGADLEGLESFASWTPQFNSPENAHFAELFEDEYEREPSISGLLGYEWGLIIKQAVVDLGTERATTKNLRNAIENVNINGPRGELNFAALNRTNFDHYLLRVTKSDTGAVYVNQVVEKLQDIPGLLESTVAEEPLLKAGGWTNAYLCD